MPAGWKQPAGAECTSDPAPASRAGKARLPGQASPTPARGLHVAAGVGLRLRDTLAQRPAVPTSALCVRGPGGLSPEPLFLLHPWEVFVVMSTKRRPGALRERHRPFHGVWGPEVPSLACEPSLGSALTVQCLQPVDEALLVPPASLLTCSPRPHPDNAHTCSSSAPLHPLFRLSGRPVRDSKPRSRAQLGLCLPQGPSLCLPWSRLWRLAVSFRDSRPGGQRLCPPSDPSS